jgi:hypothetical protein
VRNRTGISLLSQRHKREAESLETSQAIEVNRLYPNFKKNNQQPTAADPLTSTYRSSFRLMTADATTELRFVLRSFDLLCGPSPCLSHGEGLTEK